MQKNTDFLYFVIWITFFDLEILYCYYIVFFSNNNKAGKFET